MGSLLRFGAESISRSLVSGARRKKRPRDARVPEVPRVSEVPEVAEDEFLKAVSVMRRR